MSTNHQINLLYNTATSTLMAQNGNGKMVESSKLVTTVNQGDTIVWQLANNSDISSISQITPGMSVDVLFSSLTPNSNPNPTSWTGTVDAAASYGDYDYSISIQIASGVVSKFDPKISVVVGNV